MGKLTIAVAKELAGGDDVRKIKRLNASGRGLAEIGDLSRCSELVRLDLSSNAIAGLGGVVRCTTLTWLDLSQNRLDSLDGVGNLVNLVVLRASHNLLKSCGNLCTLTNLKALILSHNELSSLQGLSHLKQLNTLVLSHNSFESVCVTKLGQLSKLSLSHNRLKAIPNTQFNAELKELRLNDNKVGSLPASLKLNRKLRILDLGNNGLCDFSVLEPLKTVVQLVNLNLKGNRLCEQGGYPEEVLQLRPSLTVLDGKKKEKLNLPVRGSLAVRRTVSQPLVGEEKKQMKSKKKKKGEEVEEDDKRKVKEKEEEKEMEDEEEVWVKDITVAKMDKQCQKFKSLLRDRPKSKTKRTKEHNSALEQQGDVEGERTESLIGKKMRKKKMKRAEIEAHKNSKGVRRGRDGPPLVSESESTSIHGPLGTRLDDCDLSQDSSPPKKKLCTGQGSETRDSVEKSELDTTTGAGGELSTSHDSVKIFTDDRQSEVKGVRRSLKSTAKRNSGVVAVKNVRRRKRLEGARAGSGWDPLRAVVHGNTSGYQVGSGQGSTWT